MHYVDHILECPIGPSLKVVQLRRLFDWTNMAAALPQFFGAARHPCFEVSGHDCVTGKLIQNSSHELAKQSSLFSAFRKCLKLQNWYQNVLF